MDTNYMANAGYFDRGVLALFQYMVSGREVFELHPELVNDDDEEADDAKYEENGDEVVEEMEEVEEVYQDIDVARFVPKEVDSAGITVASSDRFTAKSEPSEETDENKLSEAFATARTWARRTTRRPYP
ncbi:hypothetical protein GJAV_G00182560 [Gymnothorax javanicus]|nr:hypothetical protein GJAV_G00182560 [Gymnothorax javanicus]